MNHACWKTKNRGKVSLHALRDGQPRIDHTIDLCRFSALADERQAGVGGQVQLACLAHFKFRLFSWVKRCDAVFSQIINKLCLIYDKRTRIQVYVRRIAIT
jgi:hypothetical protein